MVKKIAVNLLPFRKELGGVGKYALNILHELSNIDSTNLYYLYLSRESREHFEGLGKNFYIIEYTFNSNNILVRILFEQLVFPFILLFKGNFVLFTPSVAVPILYFGKKITVVHDIAYKRIKDKYTRLRRIYINLITSLSVRRSQRVLTVSESSKRELAEEFGIELSKIAVSYNGIDLGLYSNFDGNRIQNIKKTYNLPDSYILYVGAIEPGKNLNTLIEVYHDIVDLYPDLFLVVTGGIKWKTSPFFNLIKKLDLCDKVIILPYISEIDLPGIYKNAKMFIYISLYEGFGIPVLEGIASNIPVVASRIGSISEFADGIAVLVDPLNKKEIVEKVKEILDKGLLMDDLRDKVSERIQKFNWRDSALVVYQKLMEL